MGKSGPDEYGRKMTDIGSRPKLSALFLNVLVASLTTQLQDLLTWRLLRGLFFRSSGGAERDKKGTSRGKTLNEAGVVLVLLTSRRNLQWNP